MICSVILYNRIKAHVYFAMVKWPGSAEALAYNFIHNPSKNQISGGDRYNFEPYSKSSQLCMYAPKIIKIQLLRLSTQSIEGSLQLLV